LLRLMVAVQADGSYEGYQIRFDFAKKRKAQRLLSILMSLNVKYKVGNKNKRRTFRFSISEEEAAYQFIKTLIPDKVFDWNLLQLDKESLYVILDELEFWDGHRDKRSNRTSFEYSSAIQQNIDVIQAISHLCLHRVHFKKHVGTIRANISMHNKVQVTSIKASVENYRGKVYCLTVPSGFFLVKSNDKIFITGNSEEYHKGKSFVGSAGKHLNRLLANAGLHRGSLYLTNVSKEKAPGNKMANMPFDQLQLWKADLIDEINLLPNPKILVPLGNYALEAVTGRSGITNLRGSVLHPTSRIKHDCIVIPTFHPSKLHYDYTAWPLIVADFMRIKKSADSGFNFKFPTYSFILKPTFDQVMTTLEKLEKMDNTLMTIDVETPHMLLSCFSIAWSRSEAICIPFFWGTGKDYWSQAEEVAVWQRLSEVLPKLNLTNQNVLFDWSILLQHGIKLKIPKFDSMLMHSCLYSELPHRLEIITSIYTDVEFYKRDEKEEKGSSLKAGQEMAHWRYCCYDSVAALWSIEELLKELVEENMIDPYLNLFADLIEPIFLMNITGIRTDSEKLKSVRKDLQKNIKTVDTEIERAVGHELNVKSPKQVAHALFDELNMVGYKSRQTGKTTTSEKDLIKLAHKYQIDLPLLIVKNRKDYKLLSLFSEENIDDDGRIRCQYSLTRTKTGRIASKKSFSGRGMNLQNVKREGPARSFFVPEKGHVLIGADQKNAEARVMAWLSRDEALLEVFASGKSIHMENAKN
ncbi:MAG: hypothetical protein KAR20_15070, partial [Candidatus Heimdallarchaeota archaeon]|nr:hypothetical protein [Candidatus Heimdallarchaeota archaeon]